ncbi:YczE/YyaS/YitT family protein [Sediminivirga luteola]|uniref:membrane protein YczE n=1 Tax=Sediminivirga luteola TaxID=1774748 RepID=UPI001F577780|nr:hypothetical protein [Sediminivirga luteola]MCI2267106.1 hypothetical protein [Sediminivirga luteola]
MAEVAGDTGPAADSSRNFRALAGHPLPLRLGALYGGLLLFGFSAGLMLRADLGAMPWDVLHQGIALHIPLSIGVVGIMVSVLVLLLWIPLRERPGLGTVSNAILVGLVIDATLLILPTHPPLWLACVYMIGGIVLNAAATVLYISADFGPGPRDGLMTGLVRRTGFPVFAVRTTIEVVVVVSGALLGGTFFIGTVLFALSIGPLAQFFLRHFNSLVARGRRP